MECRSSDANRAAALPDWSHFAALKSDTIEALSTKYLKLERLRHVRGAGVTSAAPHERRIGWCLMLEESRAVFPPFRRSRSTVELGPASGVPLSKECHCLRRTSKRDSPEGEGTGRREPQLTTGLMRLTGTRKNWSQGFLPKLFLRTRANRL